MTALAVFPQPVKAPTRRSRLSPALGYVRSHDPYAAGHGAFLGALERDAHGITRAGLALADREPADVHVIVLIQRSREGGLTDLHAIFEQLDRAHVSPLLAVVTPHLHFNFSGPRKGRGGLPLKLARRFARKFR